jgi:tetratricopeptide (TPR) repeat protein
VSFGEGELRYRNAFDRGAYVEAAGILDRIDWLRSDGATRRTALGGAFARQGEHAEAFRQYRRSLELGPTPQAWAGIAKLERGRGDPVAAFDAYERALAFDPVGPRFHAAAADAAFEVGKPKLGVELYRRALDEARDAGDPELVHRLESRLADHIEAR